MSSDQDASEGGQDVPPGDYRVVVYAAPDDPDALKQLLVEQLGMTGIDAQIQIHALPGILLPLLERGLAERLVGRIEELGLAAGVIHRDHVPHLEHPRPLHHARCTESGVDIIDLHGKAQEHIAWADVELISMGFVPMEKSRYFSGASLGAAMTAPHYEQSMKEFQSRGGTELWLVRRDPEVAYRLNHQEMNYEYLAERMTDSATGNFRLFLEDLVAHANDAYVTPATRAFLGHGSLRQYAFDSQVELQHSTLFHLMMKHRIDAARASQSLGE